MGAPPSYFFCIFVIVILPAFCLHHPAHPCRLLSDLILLYFYRTLISVCSSVDSRKTPSSPSTYLRSLCRTLHIENFILFHVEYSPRPVTTLVSCRISSLGIQGHVVAFAHHVISCLHLLKLSAIVPAVEGQNR